MGWLQKKAQKIFAGKLTKARLRRSGHGEPSELVHDHWIFTRPYPGEKTVSALRVNSTTLHPPKLTTTTKPRFDYNGPLPDRRGEGFLFTPDQSRQPN